MNIAYRLRIVPLALGLLTLALGFVTHFFVPAVDGSAVIRYGLFLTVAGFIFLQAMRQLKKEQQTTQKPVESAQTSQEVALTNNTYKLKNAIPFLIVRAFLSLILALLGVSLVFDGQLLWGIITCLFGGGLCVLHIYWIVQYTNALQEIKRKKQ